MVASGMDWYEVGWYPFAVTRLGTRGTGGGETNPDRLFPVPMDPPGGMMEVVVLKEEALEEAFDRNRSRSGLGRADGSFRLPSSRSCRGTNCELGPPPTNLPVSSSSASRPVPVVLIERTD